MRDDYLQQKRTQVELSYMTQDNISWGTSEEFNLDHLQLCVTKWSPVRLGFLYDSKWNRFIQNHRFLNTYFIYKNVTYRYIYMHILNE